MRLLVNFSLLLAAAMFLAGCPGSPSANNTNSNGNTVATTSPTTANSPVNTDGNSNSNANTAVKNNDPVPTFADAATAVAEGDKYLDLSQNDKAIEAYRQAVNLNPEMADAHFKLGIAYAQIENDKESEVNQKIDPNATPTPKTAVAKVAKGKVLVPLTDSNKAFTAAVAAYKKILAKNPKDDNAHYNLGRSYNKLNDDKEAEKSIRQAVKLKPDDSAYQTELGAILIKLAKYDEALGVLKKAQRLDASNSQAEFLIEKAQAGKKRQEFGKPKAAPAPEK